MIYYVELSVAVLYVVLSLVILVITLCYEKYLARERRNLSFWELTKKFAKDYPLVGKIFRYAVYGELIFIPSLLFLMMILKSMKYI
jgi:hypothetical protein